MNLEKSILDTIIYFDIFDYPLKLSELRQWLFQYKIEINDLEKVLEQSEILKDKINRQDGFYFLKGREEIIKIRKERKEIDAKKIKKAFKISKFLSLIPFIKGIAVCNNLGYLNAPEGSDIDLFIITLKNRIWMARFLTILPLKLFGLRPSEKNKKDKICVHFFITENNLSLENILLQEKNGIPDIHFIYWLTQFLPLYGDDNIWQKFYEVNNWLKKFLPNFEFKSGYSQIEQPIFLRKIKKFIQFIHSHFLRWFPENIFKWFQLKIMPENLIKLSREGSDVIISDKILKLHQKDKREFYRQKFIENRLLTERL